MSSKVPDRQPRPAPSAAPRAGAPHPDEPSADRTSRWTRNLQENPGHSQWYIQRWEAMRQAGKDLDGEARLADALCERGSRILDAGSGTGRVGGVLHDRGHEVTGVDIDPALVDYARAHSPGPEWILGDLADLPNLIAPELHGTFDLIVAAGNVMTFPAAATRGDIWEGFATLVKPGGRVVAGFGTRRGYSLAEYTSDAARAGFGSHQVFRTWDLRPAEPDPEFVVCIATKS